MTERKRQPKPKKAALEVWVVIHCEYGDKASLSEMVFHVASSRRAVEGYVRRIGVFPFSWWKVECRMVDQPNPDADDLPVRLFFNYRGQLRKKPPYAAALRAFDRWQQERAAKQGDQPKD